MSALKHTHNFPVAEPASCHRPADFDSATGSRADAGSVSSWTLTGYNAVKGKR